MAPHCFGSVFARPRSHGARPLCVLAICLWASAGALAQSTPSTPAPKAPAKQPSKELPKLPLPSGAKGAKSALAVATPLSDEPFVIESVGLSFYLPLGAQADATSIGSQSTVTVEPSDKGWYATITTPRTSNPDTTVQQVGEEATRQILESSGTLSKGTEVIGYNGKPISQDFDLSINGRAAARFYIELPRGKGQDPLVRGQTIFKVGNDRFVIFEFFCSKVNFDKSRGEYELMVGTANFSGAEDAATARVAAVDAGVKLLSQLTEQDLREVATKAGERWERLYRPANTEAAADEQEVAYRRMRVWLGTRGELQGSKAAPSKEGVESQQGILVRVDARSLDEGRVLDSQGIYFVSFDRTEEAWTLKNAVREGKKSLNYTETGARSGKSMTINTDTSGEPGRTIKPIIQGDGYVSRVESFLIPQLLIRGGIPGTYGFYTYQSDTATIRLRRDDLSQPPDRPGLFVVATKLKDDAKPMVSQFNQDGDLIQTQMPDGSRWEPIKLDRLVRLWRDKNLPMD
jgi:hypothetical protein